MQEYYFGYIQITFTFEVDQHADKTPGQGCVVLMFLYYTGFWAIAVVKNVNM